MHKLEIPQADINLEYPSSIDELSRPQYLLFSTLNYQFAKGIISFDDLKTKLVYGLLPLSRKRKLDNTLATESHLHNVSLIADTFESFYDTKTVEGAKQKSVILDCLQDKIGQLKINGSNFNGPGDALTKINFGQYIGALNAFHDYSATQEESFLDQMLSYLYIEEGLDYDPKQIELNAKRFSKLDISHKYGLYLFFAASNKFIVTNKRLEIPGGNHIDISVLFKPSQGSSSGSQLGMLGALYKIAETGVFGDIDNTAQKGLYDVLVYMAQRHHDALKIEADAKKRRP